MSRLPGIAVRTVLLVLAVLLPSAWPTGLARPDLVVVVVAAAALMRGPVTGALVGLAGGWLLDLVPPGAWPAGASALAYAAVGLGLGAVRRTMATSPVLPWLATVLGAAGVLAVRGVTAAAGAGRVLVTDLLWSWSMTLAVAVLLLPVLLVVERALAERRWA